MHNWRRKKGEIARIICHNSLLRGRANRLATFHTWLCLERFNSLPSDSCYISYSPIGASSYSRAISLLFVFIFGYALYSLDSTPGKKFRGAKVVFVFSSFSYSSHHYADGTYLLEHVKSGRGLQISSFELINVVGGISGTFDVTQKYGFPYPLVNERSSSAESRNLLRGIRPIQTGTLYSEASSRPAIA